MWMNMKFVLGVLGNATAMALFVSPMPTFLTIYKKKSTQEFSGLPYVCTLFNCMLWVVYGLPIVRPNRVLILTINGFGTVLETIYIAVYFKYASPEKKVRMTRLVVAVLVTQSIVVVIIVFALHSLYARQLVAGILCVVLGIVMYASPLSVVSSVIRTRSVQYMPFLLSFFNFINSSLWTAYSFVTKDIFVALPNGLGCLFAITQLGLYAIYRNATPACEMCSVDHKNGKAMETDYPAMQKSLADDQTDATAINVSSPLRSEADDQNNRCHQFTVASQ